MGKKFDDLSVFEFLYSMLRVVGLPIIVMSIIYKFIDYLFVERKRGELNGKTVLITGASSGLGEALAHIFFDQGCKVVLAARREDELKRVQKDLLSKKMLATFIPLVVPLDLTEIGSFEEKIQRIHDECGSIDILINNGGISTRANVMDTTIDVDKQVMTVNYFGPVALTKAVLPKMVKNNSGHIVFVSSIQGLIAIPHRSSYSASKHALQAFADSLRAEVNQYKIKVSIASPGYIQTALSQNALTATGEKYGVMDKATASGYTPEYVAKEIMKMVVKKEEELILSTIGPKLAIYIRFLMPPVYFLIMKNRAKKMQ